MRMKKIISLMLATAALSASTAVLAQSPSVILNGEKLAFETDPYIEDDLTMVPFRAIFEAVGASVIWDESTRTVIAMGNLNGNATSIALQIDSVDAFVNNEKVLLEKAAEITNDSTFVPLRFVMESLGADVQWDNDTYSVIITTNQEAENGSEEN